MKMLRCIFFALISTVVFAADIGGRWDGVIGPGQLDLEFIVVFDAENDNEGLLSIPVQGLLNHPIGQPEIDGTSISFPLPGVAGNPGFTGEIDGEAITGMFSQSGMDFPFFLDRTDTSAVAGPERPQEPKAPFAYDSIDVVAEHDGATLTGIVTIPEGGATTGVLLINGSGPQDRDSALFGHKPFLVWADYLTNLGFATARFDDRGIGGSTGTDGAASYDDLVADMVAAANVLIDEAGVTNVVLLGHSQGGYLAPVVAQHVPETAGTILLASPAVSGADVLILQNELIIRADAGGAPPAVVNAAIEQQLAFVQTLIDLLVAEDYDGARQFIEDYVRASVEPLPESARPSEEILNEVIEAQVEANVSPVMQSFLTFDPQPFLEVLTVPTLAIYGGLDVQVDAGQSAEPLEAALNTAGNNDFDIVTISDLNHLLQPAITGGLAEYSTIAVTIDDRVLELVGEWLTTRF